MKCGSSRRQPMRIATCYRFAVKTTSRLAQSCCSMWMAHHPGRFLSKSVKILWVPIPPSSFAALAGATVLLNLSASNVTIAKDAYRHSLVANQSARCLAAYLYTAAGAGESTTDLAWDGHALVYENGTLLAESERFKPTSQLVTADLDIERLIQERLRMNTFGQSMQHYRHELTAFPPYRCGPCRAHG